MTQLMLFDAPTRNTIPTHTDQATPRQTQRIRATAATTDGPQRMGSLAHLVLARYDMVARRREAQRRSASAKLDVPAVEA